ncbi:MAG: RDD family protein [Bacilli bacterium]
MNYKCGKEVFFKRVCAFLIDALCIGLAFILMITIFDLTVMNSSAYKKAYQKQINIGLECHLFRQKEDGSLEFVVGNERDEAIKNFYIWYEGDDSTYQAHKGKEEYQRVLFYFDTDSNEYTLIDGYDVEAYNSFLANEMKIAYYDVLCNDIEYKQLRNETSSYISSSLISSVVVPCILFLYFIPLILKKGQTIGKKLMRVEIINIATQENIKEGFFTLRTLVLFIEFLSLGILAMVSLAICIFTKKGFTIHDLLVQSMVVSRGSGEIDEKAKDKLIKGSKDNGTK